MNIDDLLKAELAFDAKAWRTYKKGYGYRSDGGTHRSIQKSIKTLWGIGSHVTQHDLDRYPIVRQYADQVVAAVDQGWVSGLGQIQRESVRFVGLLALRCYVQWTPVIHFSGTVTRFTRDAAITITDPREAYLKLRQDAFSLGICSWNAVHGLAPVVIGSGKKRRCRTPLEQLFLCRSHEQSPDSLQWKRMKGIELEFSWRSIFGVQAEKNRGLFRRMIVGRSLEDVGFFFDSGTYLHAIDAEKDLSDYQSGEGTEQACLITILTVHRAWCVLEHLFKGAYLDQRIKLFNDLMSIPYRGYLDMPKAS